MKRSPDFKLERIRELRKMSRLTQGYAADGMGIERAILARYEGGDRIPPVDKLMKIARFYEVSLDYIVGDTDNPKRYPPSEKIASEEYMTATKSLTLQQKDKADKEISKKRRDRIIKGIDLGELPTSREELEYIVRRLVAESLDQLSKMKDQEESEDPS